MKFLKERSGIFATILTCLYAFAVADYVGWSNTLIGVMMCAAAYLYMALLGNVADPEAVSGTGWIVTVMLMIGTVVTILMKARPYAYIAG